MKITIEVSASQLARMRSLAKKLEVPASFIRQNIIASVPIDQLCEDDALWREFYVYPDRETAVRVARAGFARCRATPDYCMRYRSGKKVVGEKILNPKPFVGSLPRISRIAA